MIDWKPNGLIAHNLDRPAGLIECDLVLDVGAGLRPMQWYEPSSHVCVEPHPAYAARLEENGYQVVPCTAQEWFAARGGLEWDGAIYLLDVIEHMTRADGEEVLSLAVAQRPRQLVVFTPLGFLRQVGDAWGLGGDQWQKHRSGWLPVDFPGWRIEEYGRGFFATWTRSTRT